MTAESDGSTRALAEAGPRLGSRAPAYIQRSRPLHIVWQVGVFVVGLAVVAGGVVLLPLPGPGWLVIFGGVAIWGTEFSWAQRVLYWAKLKARGGVQAAKRRFGSGRDRRSGDAAERVEPAEAAGPAGDPAGLLAGEAVDDTAGDAVQGAGDTAGAPAGDAAGGEGDPACGKVRARD